MFEVEAREQKNDILQVAPRKKKGLKSPLLTTGLEVPLGTTHDLFHKSLQPCQDFKAKPSTESAKANSTCTGNNTCFSVA